MPPGRSPSRLRGWSDAPGRRPASIARRRRSPTRAKNGGGCESHSPPAGPAKALAQQFSRVMLPLRSKDRPSAEPGCRLALGLANPEARHPTGGARAPALAKQASLVLPEMASAVLIVRPKSPLFADFYRAFCVAFRAKALQALRELRLHLLPIRPDTSLRQPARRQDGTPPHATDEARYAGPETGREGDGEPVQLPRRPRLLSF
jgi:hypothetical protein